MTDPKYRTWAYRLAAPIAFFVAATVLVILIENGLGGGSTSTSTTAISTTTAHATTSTATTTTKGKKKKVYRVQKGDTLESIAAKFSTTVDDLLSLNPGIDPLALSPGQKVRVA